MTTLPIANGKEYGKEYNKRMIWGAAKKRFSSHYYIVLMVTVVFLILFGRYMFKSYGDDNSTGHVWPNSPLYASPNEIALGSLRPCSSLKAPMNIFVFINSAIRSTKRREQVRKVWAKSLPIVQEKCPMFIWDINFILGESISKEEEEQIAYESNEFGDVLVASVKDFDGSETLEVSGTTEKTLFAFKYAAKRNFDYIVRGADDAYLNPINFANAVVNMPRERLFWGRFVYDRKMNHPKIRNFLRSHYLPPFTLGMGFVITPDLARWVANSEIPFLPAYPEDGMLGLWFGGLDILRYDDPRFHHVPGSDPPEKWAVGQCDGSEIVSHYLSAKHFDQIDDEGNLHC